MSCINSLTQADIGLSQKVMRNAKTFYHNSTIGASGTCITFVKLSIGTPRRKSEVFSSSFFTQNQTKLVQKGLRPVPDSLIQMSMGQGEDCILWHLLLSLGTLS